MLYVSKVCDCMSCITDIIDRSHKVQIFITLRLMCFVVSQVCDCMACWLCIPWGDICGWNMGPDNTPDITSHHLHNLYHRFIRRQSFEKNHTIKGFEDKFKLWSKWEQEVSWLNLCYCFWIAIIHTINFDTKDAINHRAIQLFVWRFTFTNKMLCSSHLNREV